MPTIKKILSSKLPFRGIVIFLLLLSTRGVSQTVGNMSQSDYDVILQMNIGTGNGSTSIKRTNRAAFLEIGDSLNSRKALLLPRGNRDSVANAIEGLVFYDRITKTFIGHTDTGWVDFGGGGTTISFPYTTTKYYNGFGTFGSLPDTVHAQFSAGINMIYNSSTGVFDADTTTGALKLATQGDITRAISASTQTFQQTLTAGSTLTTNNTISIGSNTLSFFGPDGNHDRTIEIGVSGVRLANIADAAFISTELQLFDSLYLNSQSVLGPESGFIIYPDSIVARPDNGKYYVKGLANSPGTKSVRYNPSTGLFTYADTTLGGGSYTDSDVEDYLETYTGDVTFTSTVSAIGASKVTNTMLAGSIDGTKIADGSVTSTEFQYINTLTSNAQTQINNKEASFTETTEEFTGSTSLSITLSNTPKAGKAEMYFLNGIVIIDANVSRTGTGVTFSNFTRLSSDIITAKYSY